MPDPDIDYLAPMIITPERAAALAQLRPELDSPDDQPAVGEHATGS